MRFRILLYTLIAMLMMFSVDSCTPEVKKDYTSLIEEGDLCDEHGSESYRLAATKIETKTLYYFIEDDRIDPELVFKAASEYAVHSKIEVVEVYDWDKADIIVKSEYIDGLGSVLGKAWYPSNMYERGVVLRPIIFDENDFFKEGKDIWKNQYIIILHEFGHIFGIKHSGLRSAALYPHYQEELLHLGIDDILGIRSKYGNRDPFKYDGVEYVYVSPNDNTKITDNFLAKEFVSNCSDSRDVGNYVAKSLIESVQRVRSEFGPIKINSSFRTENCNSSIAGAASQSAHQVAQAIDFSFYNRGDLTKFKTHIKNRRCIFYTLRGFGVDGIAIYSHHVHIDILDRSTPWIKYNAGQSSYTTNMTVLD